MISWECYTLTKSPLWPDLKRTGNIPQLIMTCHSKFGSSVMISWGMSHFAKISTLARSEKGREYSPTYHDVHVTVFWGAMSL